MKELRNKEGLTEAEFLARYNPRDFDRPSVTVDMVTFMFSEEQTAFHQEQAEVNLLKSGKKKAGLLGQKKLKVLMIKRGNHPCLGQWALPGGFVEIDESLDEAALRELKEETNLENVYLEQLFTFGDPGRDPRTRIITVAYLALLDSSQASKVCGGSDAAEARWFTVSSELLKEERNKLPDGREQILKQISLNLEDHNERLSAVLEVTETGAGNFMLKQVNLVTNQGIAFDHAKIIFYGWERLQEKLKS
jgi:8-oxo-dGTP diphosphatase